MDHSPDIVGAPTVKQRIDTEFKRTLEIIAQYRRALALASAAHRSRRPRSPWQRGVGKSRLAAHVGHATAKKARQRKRRSIEKATRRAQRR